MKTKQQEQFRHTDLISSINNIQVGLVSQSINTWKIEVIPCYLHCLGIANNAEPRDFH